MDEQRLAEAMRGAAAGAPPPSFDADDVVRESRRVTARRRSALAGGALAVLAVAGVGIGVAQEGAGGTTAASAPAPVPEAGAEVHADAAPPEDALAAPAPPAVPAPFGPAPGARSAARPPLGPADPRDCADPQDPALRAVVEEVLPEVVGAPAAPTTKECRFGGERGLTVELAGGVLNVWYLPPGSPPAPTAAGAVTEPTASGGVVRVSYVGPPGGPSHDRLAAAAAQLAPRL